LPLRVPPKVLKDPKALEDYVHTKVFPKVSASQRAYLTQFFTEIFSDGFESGDFSAWSGTTGTPTIATSPVHHGTYSANFDPGDDCYKYIAAQSTLFTRIYWYWASGSVADGGKHGIVWFQSVAGFYVAILYLRYINGAYRWSVRYNNLANYADSAQQTPTTGQWYCIEMKAICDSTAGEIHVYINGNELTDLGLTNIDTDTSVFHVKIGAFDTASSTVISYADCVVVADTYIGPEVAPKPRGSIVVHAKLAGII
jgi:hypothetical protein